MSGIDNLTAAELSAAAYGQDSPPAGWQVANYEVSPDQDNSFTEYVNGNPFDPASITQVVFTFKGSSTAENFYSDLMNDGASAWNDISTQVLSAFTLAQKTYTNATFYTDGHSLGGGWPKRWQPLRIFPDTLRILSPLRLRRWSSPGCRPRSRHGSLPATLLSMKMQPAISQPGTTLMI